MLTCTYFSLCKTKVSNKQNHLIAFVYHLLHVDAVSWYLCFQNAMAVANQSPRSVANGNSHQFRYKALYEGIEAIGSMQPTCLGNPTKVCLRHEVPS